jgi:hypothetical protein
MDPECIGRPADEYGTRSSSFEFLRRKALRLLSVELYGEQLDSDSDSDSDSAC